MDNRGVNSLNTYAYCGNNPVNNSDEDGHRWGAIIAGGVIGALSGGLSAYLKSKNIKSKKARRNAIIKGAVVGGITGAIGGAIGGWLSNVQKGVKVVKCARLAAKMYKKTKRIAAARVATNSVLSTAQSYANRQKAPVIKKVASNLVQGQGYKSNSITKQEMRTYLPTKQDAMAGVFGMISGGPVAALGYADALAFPAANVPEIEEFAANIMYSVNTSAFHAVVEHSVVALYPKVG